MQAKELFQKLVLNVLNGAPNKRMSVADLRTATKIERGITSVVAELAAADQVMYWEPLEMSTIVELKAPK